MKFRLDIQGLRALAVISVVIFHIHQKWLPGGFVGVDMFFVISGFLISKGLIKQFENGLFDFKSFVIGRIRRIVPAYFVVSLVCALLVLELFIPSDALAFLYNLRRGLIFTTNEVFATATDYFGAKSYENPLLHTWSLSIEMQFYLMLPIIMMFLPKSIYKWILIIGALLILVYTQYQITFFNNKQAMYFSTLARSSEFVIGIAINFIPNSKMISRRFKSILGILSLIALLLSCFYINEQSNFPGLLAMPVCIATALIIWLEDANINNILGNKLLVFTGKISYSLYLWHWPVLALYRYYIGIYDLTVAEMIILMLVTLVLSILSFYLIEEMFRRSNKYRFYLTMGSLSTLLVLTWYSGRYYYKGVQIFEKTYTSFDGFNIKNPGEYQGYFLLGDKNKLDDKIVLIGDSHATVMTSFFDVVGKKNNFNFSYHTINSVVPIEGVHDSIIPTAYKKQYYKALPITNDLIKKSDIIFVVKHWQGNKNGYYKDVLKKLIKKMRSNQDLVIVSDFPGLKKNPVREYSSVIKPIGFKPHKVIFPKMPQGVQQLINGHENIHYLDLRNDEYFKDAPYYKDTLMYYDKGHINHYGSVNYAKFEGDKLADLIRAIKSRRSS